MDSSHKTPPFKASSLVCVIFRFPDESLHIIEIEQQQIASAIRGEYRFWEKPAKVVGACVRVDTNLNEYQDALPNFSNEFVAEILTLLDRIEIEGDSSLAGQRHAIVEKHGMKVVIREPISGLIN